MDQCAGRCCVASCSRAKAGLTGRRLQPRSARPRDRACCSPWRHYQALQAADKVSSCQSSVVGGQYGQGELSVLPQHMRHGRRQGESMRSHMQHPVACALPCNPCRLPWTGRCLPTCASAQRRLWPSSRMPAAAAWRLCWKPCWRWARRGSRRLPARPLPSHEALCRAPPPSLLAPQAVSRGG